MRLAGGPPKRGRLPATGRSYCFSSCCSFNASRGPCGTRYKFIAQPLRRKGFIYLLASSLLVKRIFFAPHGSLQGTRTATARLRRGADQHFAMSTRSERRAAGRCRQRSLTIRIQRGSTLRRPSSTVAWETTSTQSAEKGKQ